MIFFFHPGHSSLNGKYLEIDILKPDVHSTEKLVNIMKRKSLPGEPHTPNDGYSVSNDGACPMCLVSGNRIEAEWSELLLNPRSPTTPIRR